MKVSPVLSVFAVQAVLLEIVDAKSVPHNVPRVTSNGYYNIAYFPNWDIYARNYQPAQLPIQQLTHVILSSDSYADLQKLHPGDSSTATGKNAYGCVKQLYLLKQKNRHLKVLLSTGGATNSANYSAPLATTASRANFVSSAVQFVQNWGLDGLDIDYEYPANIAAAQNFSKLLAQLRAALDAYTAKTGGSRQLISVALPAGPAHYTVMDIKGMAPYVDLWNLMLYDMSGPWSTYTAHQANLFNSTSNPKATPFNSKNVVDYCLAQGIAGNRINIGMPIYGRSFVGTKGLGQPFTGVGNGSWENGVWDYKVLPQAGAVVTTDQQARATYSWDAKKQILVSYDTVDEVKTKVAYGVSRKLGGSMFREASADRNGTGSLIGTSWAALSAKGPMDTQLNTLTYPTSQYDNIRNGMKTSTTVKQG